MRDENGKLVVAARADGKTLCRGQYTDEQLTVMYSTYTSEQVDEHNARVIEYVKKILLEVRHELIKEAYKPEMDELTALGFLPTAH